MFFDSVKRNFFALVIICITILCLLWGSNFLIGVDYQLITQDNPMPLQKLSANLLNNNFWATIITGAITVLLTGLLLYRVNEAHLFICRREPLLAIVFVLLASAFSNTHHFFSIHAAIFFILLSLNAMFYTYRREHAFYEVYLSAVFLSVATLFYAPSLYFVIALFICLGLMKPLLWRDCLVLIAGVVTPYIFCLFYYHFTIANWQMPFQLLKENLLIRIPLTIPQYNIAEWIFLAYIIMLTCLAILRLLFLPAFGDKVKAIRISGIFVWIFLISIFCFIFYPDVQYQRNMLIIILPVTVLLVNFFSSLKSNVASNIFFGLILLLIIAMQFSENQYAMVGNYIAGIYNNVLGFFKSLF